MIETDHSISSRWVKDKYGLYMCEQCNQRALYEREYSMDGISSHLCLSEYCPRCGRHMSIEEEDNS